MGKITRKEMVKLNKETRLILYNQYEILKKLDSGNVQDYEEYQDKILSGHEMFLDEFTAAFEEGLNYQECKFVNNILSLYRTIYYSYKKDEEVRESFELSDLVFKGFDGNDETEMKYLGYYELLTDLGRFQEFSELEKEGHLTMNSHGMGTSLEELRKILERSEEYEYQDVYTVEQIRYILNK